MERRLENSHRWDVSREIASWRRKILIRAGFSMELADALARNARIDIHDLLELVDRGCPPEVAARIIAPL